jgi:hypothetical protein
MERHEKFSMVLEPAQTFVRQKVFCPLGLYFNDKNNSACHQ